METSLRITFVLPFAGLVGGIRVIAIYADHLARRGHRVVAVSTPQRRPRLREYVRSVIGKRRWPGVPPDGLSYFDGLDVEHHVLDRERPVTNADVPDADVVVATWWKTVRGVYELAPEKGVKAYFVQDYGAHEGQPLNKLVETWRLPMYKITISEWLLGLVRNHADCSEIAYVPNSVDTAMFFAPPRKKQALPTVGLMYSTRPQKGLDTMLEAIELAKRDIPDLHVVAYGPSDPVSETPLPSGSEYTKLCPDDKLREIYAKCDAWLFGSRLEGFGLPILEAMACRTPVIATAAGAAPELLEGGGGVLVPVSDSAAMAHAIRRVCRLPSDEWFAMSDAAYRTATGYSWEHATDRFEAGLRAAITRRENSSSGDSIGAQTS